MLIIHNAHKPFVTVKLHVAGFPAASVAVHVTVVTPDVNVEPEGGLHETWGDTSTLSVAAGSDQDAWEDVMTILLGQVIVGAT